MHHIALHCVCNYLCFGNSLHVASQIINLHFEFTFLFFQLLLDPLKIVNLLTKLCYAVSLLLTESCSSGFMLQGGFLKITAQLLKLSFTFLVHLNLGRSGTTSFFKSLTDLFQFSREISSLLFNLSTGSTLCFNLFFKLLNTCL